MNKVFTIGYAGVEVKRFIDVLKNNNISVLVDVRSLAKSQYFPVFNDVNIKKILIENGIEYFHLKSEFGARQNDLQYYSNNVLDFEKFSQSEQFNNGINIIKEKNINVCLMCAEIDPINCHRAILCSKHIAESGLEVEHIILKRNGESLIESNNDLENRLLQLYKTDDIEVAYKNQNQKIGHKLVK